MKCAPSQSAGWRRGDTHGPACAGPRCRVQPLSQGRDATWGHLKTGNGGPANHSRLRLWEIDWESAGLPGASPPEPVPSAASSPCAKRGSRVLGNPVACPGIAFTKRPLARAGGSRQGRFECLPWALGLILESGGLEFVWRQSGPPVSRRTTPPVLATMYWLFCLCSCRACRRSSSCPKIVISGLFSTNRLNIPINVCS